MREHKLELGRGMFKHADDCWCHGGAAPAGEREPSGEEYKWPECQEFYELMQQYRHAAVAVPSLVIDRYEAIKRWLRQSVQPAPGADEGLREMYEHAKQTWEDSNPEEVRYERYWYGRMHALRDALDLLSLPAPKRGQDAK